MRRLTNNLTNHPVDGTVLSCQVIEPAEQEVKIHPLHELALRADREVSCNQTGAKQPLTAAATTRRCG